MIKELLLGAALVLAVAQAADATNCPVGGGGPPVVLPARNFYASSSGNDTANTCLASANPCTFQGALEKAAASNMTVAKPVVNLAAGTYTTGVAVAGPFWEGVANNGSSGISILGAGSTSTFIAVTAGAAAIIVTDSAAVGLTGMKITNSAGSDVFAYNNGKIATGDDLIFGKSALGMMHAEQGGTIQLFCGYSIDASAGGTTATAALQAVLGGIIEADENAGMVIAITGGTAAFSTGFADIESGSIMYMPSSDWSFTGSATGPHYYVSRNGTIETNSGIEAYLPGNAEGQISRGGIYNPPADPSVAGTTGLGTGSPSVSIASTYNSKAMAVTFNTGTAPSSSGSTTITYAEQFVDDAPVCVGNPAPGTGTWAAGATIQFSGLGQTGITLNWNNNGTNLTAAKTYYATVMCNNN